MPPHPVSNLVPLPHPPHFPRDGNTVPPVAQARNLGLDLTPVFLSHLISNSSTSPDNSITKTTSNATSFPRLNHSLPRLSHLNTFTPLATASGQEILQPHLSDSTVSPTVCSADSSQNNHSFKCWIHHIWLRGLHHSAPVTLGPEPWGHFSSRTLHFLVPPLEVLFP